MIEAKNIITLGPPPAPLHDVTILFGKNSNYEMRYRPVTSIIYISVDRWRWDPDMIVVEKQYCFEINPYYPELSFYHPREDHQNARHGRCECDHPTCGDLGIWEGTPSEIKRKDDFQVILKQRLEHLGKLETKRKEAKEQRDAKKLADPIGHEKARIKAKEAREAKKAALANPTRNPNPDQSPNRVPPGPFDGSRASLGLKGDEDNVSPA